MFKKMIKLSLLCACLFGAYVWNAGKQEERQERQAHQAEFRKSLNDPSAPPVLSARQQSPDWSIRKWLAVDRKSSDCVMADEMMDKNATVKIVKRRGRVREYYLADYISSCQSFSDRMISEIVAPQADKWCRFRQDSDRIEQLCIEWLENKDFYVKRLQAMKQPTLDRYQRFGRS